MRVSTLIEAMAKVSTSETQRAGFRRRDGNGAPSCRANEDLPAVPRRTTRKDVARERDRLPKRKRRNGGGKSIGASPSSAPPDRHGPHRQVGAMASAAGHEPGVGEDEVGALRRRQVQLDRVDRSSIETSAGAIRRAGAPPRVRHSR